MIYKGRKICYIDPLFFQGINQGIVGVEAGLGLPACVPDLFARVLPPPANIQRVRGGDVPLSALHPLCHQIFAHVQGEPDRADPRVRADPRRE